ncbi:hypothetical protein Athai_17330 [Actinocatenispora thailandica]|uniref:Cysteinyl-tRNA synthetase n=1 Tax=Actinocatenispora thailandica TaxID=227318 RepID=A0A7R7DM63_9ACTN|nr:hypothetical protein [Actinocatenispora thailandica]BCJ34230.1 hypothetical protein Athai_17330 [Actinocatenispora thailandica]
MLTVIDDRSGAAMPVGEQPSRLVRLSVVPPSGGDAVRWQAVRVLLVADLARRVLEGLHGRQVRTTLVGSAEALAPAGDRLRALWIVPPDEVRAAPAGAELVVAAADPRQPGGIDLRGGVIGAGRPVLAVAPVADLDVDGADPTAVRLALLSRPRRETVAEVRLAAADRRLARWRAEVALAARQPSAPIPAPVLARIRDACDDDLDAVTLLRALDDLDGAVPAGARLETLLYVDRILALDLARGLTAG